MVFKYSTKKSNKIYMLFVSIGTKLKHKIDNILWILDISSNSLFWFIQKKNKFLIKLKIFVLYLGWEIS